MGRLKLYDVVVIGGGPAGSWVAYRLAALGYRVAVMEQKERLGGPVCCTGIISQECVSSFAVDEGVIFRPANSAKVFSSSGKLLSLWRPEPQASIVNRPAFNVALASRARTKGAEFVLNCQVKGIEVKSDRVSIEVVGHGEGSAFFEARVVVIATGFGSSLLAKLGLGRVGDFVMGAQAEVEVKGLDEVEIYLGQEIAPGFFAWLVPTSPHRALAGLLSRRSPGLYLKKFLSHLLAHGKITSNTEPRYGGVPLKPLARTYGERLLVVGTAAGQVKPTTGGGIYYGLLCADLAADNLHRLLGSDSLSARNLAKYERDWKKRLGWELKMGYWARRFYQRLSDSQIDRIFDIIKSNGIDEALLKADDLSFDWHGRVVLRLMGQQALSKAMEAMKLPRTLVR